MTVERFFVFPAKAGAFLNNYRDKQRKTETGSAEISVCTYVFHSFLLDARLRGHDKEGRECFAALRFKATNVKGSFESRRREGFLKHNGHGEHNAGGATSCRFGQCFIVDPGLRRGDGGLVCCHSGGGRNPPYKKLQR